jgi:hypothetical protein
MSVDHRQVSKGTKVRTVRVEDELWEAALRKATEEGDNLSAIIRDALRQYINESETE